MRIRASSRGLNATTESKSAALRSEGDSIPPFLPQVVVSLPVLTDAAGPEGLDLLIMDELVYVSAGCRHF